MILEPIGDNIVIELPQEESRENITTSGIVLPKKSESEKDEISEDDMKKQQDAIQKATDKFIADIDSLLAEKEKDILKV